jgi:NAD(P)-dependent dehydrogenase (short-subunit alcohol dehydrogenase family)
MSSNDLPPTPVGSVGPTGASASTEPAPVAVVTGGSQGLGRELARALLGRGWTVVIDARRADRLREAVDDLRGAAAAPERLVAVVGDVTEPDHRADLAGQAAAHGPVALVVNNASTLGASPLPTLDDLDPEVFARTLATNVVAPLAVYQSLRPHLAPGATIVNVSSDAAVEPYPTWGGYGASKAALDHLSRVLAAERPDLRVYAVDPGDMRTEMHQDAFPGEDISDRPPPADRVAAILALLDGSEPSGRVPAREVAT